MDDIGNSLEMNTRPVQIKLKIPPPFNDVDRWKKIIRPDLPKEKIELKWDD